MILGYTKRKSSMGLGVKLKRHRIKAGLTQYELATKAKVSQPTITQIESGRRTPSLQSLARICVALGVDMGEVIG